MNRLLLVERLRRASRGLDGACASDGRVQGSERGPVGRENADLRESMRDERRGRHKRWRQKRVTNNGREEQESVVAWSLFKV